jgi:hypothetical protein
MWSCDVCCRPRAHRATDYHPHGCLSVLRQLESQTIQNVSVQKKATLPHHGEEGNLRQLPSFNENNYSSMTQSNSYDYPQSTASHEDGAASSPHNDNNNHDNHHHHPRTALFHTLPTTTSTAQPGNAASSRRFTHDQATPHSSWMNTFFSPSSVVQTTTSTTSTRQAATLSLHKRSPNDSDNDEKKHDFAAMTDATKDPGDGNDDNNYEASMKHQNLPRRLLDSHSDTSSTTTTRSNSRHPLYPSHHSAQTTLSKRTPRRSAGSGGTAVTSIATATATGSADGGDHESYGSNRNNSNNEDESYPISPSHLSSSPTTAANHTSIRTPSHNSHHPTTTTTTTTGRFSTSVTSPLTSRRMFSTHHKPTSATTSASTTTTTFWSQCLRLLSRTIRPRSRRMAIVVLFLVVAVLVYTCLIFSMFRTIHTTAINDVTSRPATPLIPNTKRSSSKTPNDPTFSSKKEEKRSKPKGNNNHPPKQNHKVKQSNVRNHHTNIPHQKQDQGSKRSSVVSSSSSSSSTIFPLLQPRVIRLLDVDTYHKVSIVTLDDYHDKGSSGLYHSNKKIQFELDYDDVESSPSEFVSYTLDNSTSTVNATQVPQLDPVDEPPSDAGSSIDLPEDKEELLREEDVAENSNEDHDEDEGDFEKDECIPLAKWQTYSFVNCNTLHELDMILGTTRALDDSLGVAGHNNNNSSSNNTRTPPVQLDLLGQGWFRSAWKVETVYDDALVLKTLRLEREFLEEYFDLHRRDAVAMERLTHSPFVMNVYGYCGQSALNELANFNNPDVTSLEALTKRLRGKQGEAVDFLKLKLAMSIATGLAHVHEVNNRQQEEDDVTVGGGDKGGETSVVRDPRDYLPAMVHYDLNPRNIAIVQGGKPKLNDFNIAEFLKYNPKTNTTCGFNSRLHEPWWRAPEEMNTNHTHVGMSLVNEKVDVYALGNILHHILTTHSPRGKMKKERMDEVRVLVRQGIPPLLPDAYRQRAKKDGTYKVFLQAMELCFVADPDQRGTARQVADLLYERIRTLQDKEESEPQPKQSQDHHQKKPHHHDHHKNRHGKH